MSSVSVVIPVKDAGPLLERVLDAVRAQGNVELLVIDSGSRDGSREVARASRRRAGRDSAGRVRPWANPQPRRRARLGRPDRIPHAGRRAYGGMARRPPRGVYPLGPSGSRVRPPPSLRGHKPDDRAGADRVLRGLLAGWSADAPTARGPGLSLERERLLCACLLGGDPFRGCGLRRGSGLRWSDARSRLDEGLPPASGGSARARLWACRVHEALFR